MADISWRSIDCTSISKKACNALGKSSDLNEREYLFGRNTFEGAAPSLHLRQLTHLGHVLSHTLFGPLSYFLASSQLF